MALMATGIQPIEATLRAYQVGFGDCFLLTFHYPARAGKAAFDRHLLIDFGSTGKPAAEGENLLRRVAADIAKECGGKLDAVIATHRHKDHISGFATEKNGKGTGDVIKSLKPDLVLQPWTEDPDAKPNATTPRTARSGKQAFVAQLADIHSFSASALAEAARLKGKIGARTSAQLAFLGEDNLANRSAIDNLMTMAKNRYLNFGMKSGLEKILPGVKVHVLGPPSIAQSEGVQRQRERDEAEFWHLQARGGERFMAMGKPPFPRAAKRATLPPYARWIVPRLRAIRGDQLLEIVRIMDDVLNNTSIILLFEAGKKKLLFPGDAQIENWSYALKEAPDKEAIRKLLADVDLYKVGHHGSLNATPKTLWNLFKKKKTARSAARLQSVVSTMAGKHGSTDNETEVPRRKLVDALRAETEFFTTQDLVKRRQLKEIITIAL
jgi:hypothetical protein